MGIRQLQPCDAAAFRALRLAASLDMLGAFDPSPQTPAMRLEGRPGDAIFGAFYGNELMGVAGVTCEARDKAAHGAKVCGLYVGASPARHRSATDARRDRVRAGYGRLRDADARRGRRQRRRDRVA
jgi:hypothetical protein